MTAKTWSSHPLDMAIVEILERRGPLTDEELYDILKESYEDMGFGVLNKTLMKMEIEGKIYVSTLARGKRRIELIAKKEA
jgi:DNA-binding PadR family transcriptional regulator